MTKTTDQYCLDIPTSREFDCLFSDKQKQQLDVQVLGEDINVGGAYVNFVHIVKERLSDYFNNQGIETPVISNIIIDPFFGGGEADISFECSTEEKTRLQENLHQIFGEFELSNDASQQPVHWKNLPLQKYPTLGKF